jgi:hypothetical protein
MNKKSIILIGNPDSGKSNFVARLWLALQSKKFSLLSTRNPDNIKYVEELAAHLLQSRFAPRTDKEEAERNFDIEVQSSANSELASILIPDVSGELWKKAVETLEISEKWLNVLKESSAALLFVRVLSPLNSQPLDWVNSRKLLQAGIIPDAEQNSQIPTQVSLIELLRFLGEKLKVNGSAKPKVAVIVTAWDLLHQDEAALGPEHYLKTQFPLFAGRLQDSLNLDVKVFGSSIVGGDFTIDEFVQRYQSGDVDNAGYIMNKEDDNWSEIQNLTTPIHWLLH